MVGMTAAAPLGAVGAVLDGAMYEVEGDGVPAGGCAGCAPPAPGAASGVGAGACGAGSGAGAAAVPNIGAAALAAADQATAQHAARSPHTTARSARDPGAVERTALARPGRGAFGSKRFILLELRVHCAT
jgi:hypothetical protein